MELLSRNGRAARVLPPDRRRRPTAPTPQVELVRRRYRLGGPRRDARVHAGRVGSGQATYDDLRKRVVEAYKALEADSDFVLCEGTDFVGATPALDFGLNADLANELGAPVLVVVKAARPRRRRRRSARPRLARPQGMHDLRRDRQPGRRRARRRGHARGFAPTAAPSPSTSCRSGASSPTRPSPRSADVARRHELVRDAGRGLAARGARRPRRGDERRALRRPPRRGHARDRPRRPAGHPRREPRIDGLADVPLRLRRRAAHRRLPLGENGAAAARAAHPSRCSRSTQLTHEAATAVQGVRPHLRPGDDRKIAAALGLFEAEVDTAELERRIAVDRPVRRDADHVRVRADRARAGDERRHVVLPGRRRRPDPARSRDHPAPRRCGRHAPRRPRRRAGAAAASASTSTGVAVVDPASSRCATGSRRSTTSCGGTRA